MSNLRIAVTCDAVNFTPIQQTELSRLLDAANAREQEHDEEALLHFFLWRYHSEQAAIARAERCDLEADIWAERRVA
jgi:hypothetical protein